MYLLRDVMDKQLVDRRGSKCGKVDDLLLELRPGKPPVVKALLTGHGALLELAPGPVKALGYWLEKRVLGKHSIQPEIVEWRHVTRIDVAVHLDLDRRPAGLVDTEQAVWEQWVKPLPWSER